jgi:hypothetical protein
MTSIPFLSWSLFTHADFAADRRPGFRSAEPCAESRPGAPARTRVPSADPGSRARTRVPERGPGFTSVDPCAESRPGCPSSDPGAERTSRCRAQTRFTSADPDPLPERGPGARAPGRPRSWRGHADSPPDSGTTSRVPMETLPLGGVRSRPSAEQRAISPRPPALPRPRESVRPFPAPPLITPRWGRWVVGVFGGGRARRVG